MISVRIFTFLGLVQAQDQLPGTSPQARGPPLRRHQNIHVNMEEEREHIKAHIKEDYIDTSTLDDNNLLMQYFKKHDSDNNMKLDGLELLKAISNMEEDDHHHDDKDNDTSDNSEDEDKKKLNLDEMVPIVDSILEEDDKDKDGYINWPEFISRQKQNDK
eukprot:TRINITY_DN13181_c0_g1_i2.p1 TRINITY_DN13181_c0_g1~~TRINITY_DN13181_c0_g1_i2.p1  ORF type:complete len:160 (-),score=50.74 TRINITY_DN13181_c0_g1_i2:68-547(-)